MTAGDGSKTLRVGSAVAVRINESRQGKRAHGARTGR